MFTNNRLCILLAVMMLVMGLLFLVLSYFARKPVPESKVCRSEYSITLHSDHQLISSKGEFYLFTEKNNIFVISVTGKLFTEDRTYNIKRRIYYKSIRNMHGKKNEWQSSFIRSDKHLIDNAPDNIVNHRLFGTMENAGNKYKVETLDDNDIVISTYFSPLYVCQLEQ